MWLYNGYSFTSLFLHNHSTTLDGKVINFHRTVNYERGSINHKISIHNIDVFIVVCLTCLLPIESNRMWWHASVLKICTHFFPFFCSHLSVTILWLRQIMLYDRAINRHFSCFDSFLAAGGGRYARGHSLYWFPSAESTHHLLVPWTSFAISCAQRY